LAATRPAPFDLAASDVTFELVGEFALFRPSFEAWFR
jgi:hypothetical protein